jgi:hypothetical protein
MDAHDAWMQKIGVRIQIGVRTVWERVGKIPIKIKTFFSIK